jgi:hypothetical protein
LHPDPSTQPPVGPQWIHDGCHLIARKQAIG